MISACCAFWYSRFCIFILAGCRLILQCIRCPGSKSMTGYTSRNTRCVELGEEEWSSLAQLLSSMLLALFSEKRCGKILSLDTQFLWLPSASLAAGCYPSSSPVDALQEGTSAFPRVKLDWLKCTLSD